MLFEFSVLRIYVILNFDINLRIASRTLTLGSEYMTNLYTQRRDQDLEKTSLEILQKKF